MIVVRLEEQLKKQKKSVWWLSQAANTPYASLWKLIRRESPQSISLPMLFRICAALGCSVEEVLVYEDDEESRAIKALIKSKKRK
jgi:DNA-binding Xre family transcriptional regulator